MSNVKDRLKQKLSGSSQPASQAYLDAGFTLKGSYGEGQIYENPSDNSLVYLSPGFTSTDQDFARKIMQGETPQEILRQRQQQQLIDNYPVTSRAASFLQSIPFVGTYTDEALSAIGGDQVGSGMRTLDEAMSAQRPIESAAIDVGAALSTLPAASGAGVTNALGRLITAGGTGSRGGNILRSAAVGATAGGTEGAVSGFGRGGTMDERVRNAALDAGIGFATGGVIGGGAPIVGEGISTAASAIIDRVRALKGQSAPKIAKALGITRDAAKVIQVALRNDDFDKAADVLEKAGGNAMLADAGTSTQRLLDVSVTSGGAAPRIASDAINERASKEALGVTATLDEVLGAPQGVNTARGNVRQSTSVNRDTAYKVAYAQPIDYASQTGRSLENLLKRVPESAIRQANMLMKTQGDTSKQILARIDDNGNVTFERLPDVRQFDYITRALGDVADAQNGAGKLGGTTQLGRATGNLQKLIRQQLRRAVPEYGAALDVAADAISRSRAIENGAAILRPSTTRETVRDSLRGASRAERDAAKQGLRSAIDDTLSKVRAVATDPNVDIREMQKLTNLLSSRDARDKFTYLLGKNDADKLFEQLEPAIISLELRAAIARNSATQQRTAIKGAVDEITQPGAVNTLLSGEPIQAARRVTQTLSGATPEARQLRQMGIYDEIASVLTRLKGDDAKRALGIIKRNVEGEALTESQARIVSRALTSPSAVALYGGGTNRLEGATQ